MDETIDLVALSQAVIADRAPIALRQNRDIELDAAMASLPILGNGQALSSALANVLDNAIRAEPEGGLIRVVIDPTGRLDIVDHGIGVAPEHVELVFEPFWRRDQKPPGAGLGLAIVKEIVDRHGMTISVLTTPGGGATFRFDFSALAVR
jgi:signal transduction histidine kinase